MHALVLGYWHTILTPPITFAKLAAETVQAARAQGIRKPVTVALAGDTEVEEAARYLEAAGIPAYAYAAEKAVAALAAKYQYWRHKTGTA